MADAKPSRPDKSEVEGAEQVKPAAGQKTIKKGGREYIEYEIQGKVCRNFIDNKKA